MRKKRIVGKGVKIRKNIIIVFVAILGLILVLWGIGTLNVSAEPGFESYVNAEYGFGIEYPEAWEYKEFPSEMVTTVYEIYNFSSDKYEKVFVDEMSDYIVSFGPSEHLMPSVFRGGQGYVVVEIYDMNMDELFDVTYERSGWVKHYVESGKFNMTLEGFREDFFSETVFVGEEIEGFRKNTVGQIFDAVNDFEIIETRIEHQGIVINVVMENVDNIENVGDVYEGVLSSFRFL